MRLPSFLRFLLVLPLALALAACDSNDGGGGPGGGGPGGDDGPGGGLPGGTLGESSVSVTEAGPFNSSFTGGAFFVFDDEAEDDEEVFSIVLYAGSLMSPTQTFQEMVVINWVGNRPGTGTYPFTLDASDGGAFGGYVKPVESMPVSIAAEEGTVTITSSSTSRVEGSFTFSGPIGGAGGGQETGTVTGTFKAALFAPFNFPD